jgi:uncharacterized protein YukE
MVDLGMDVDTIRDVAAKINAQAQQLNGIVGAVDTLSTNAVDVWHGHDSTDFHGYWYNTHRPSLENLVAALTELARVLARNLAEQEQTSSSAGASGVNAFAGAPLGTVRVSGTGATTMPGELGAAGSVSGFAGARVETSGSRHAGALNYGGQASAQAGTWGDASGHANAHLLGPNPNVNVDGQFNARAGAEADASGQAQLGALGVAGSATAFAGARMSGEGGLQADLQHIEAKAGIHGFAGAEASASGQANLGDAATAHGTVGAWAGVGVDASGEFEASFKKIEADVDLGAALGIGAHVHLGFSVSPENVANDLIKNLPFHF